MQKRIILIISLLYVLLASPCLAGEKTVAELCQIAQAGGSLLVDLDKRLYSTIELATIAATLNHGATLTIKMGDNALSVSQCTQITRAKPGQVQFWF